MGGRRQRLERFRELRPFSGRANVKLREGANPDFDFGASLLGQTPFPSVVFYLSFFLASSSFLVSRLYLCLCP